MLTNEKRSHRQSPRLLLVTGALSAVYAAVVLRIGFRAGWSNLTPNSRYYFASILILTVVLYVVAVIQAIVLRHREGALIPVCLAAVFGIVMCVVFFRL